MEPRHTARGITVKDGQILLMERWRDDLHYFSIPGGGIEAGETPQQAVARETSEETGITVDVGRLVIIMHDGSRRHEIYLCEYRSGEPHMPPDAEESLRASEQNRYSPRWVDDDELPGLPFGYWQPIHEAVAAGLRDGFPDTPVTFTAAA